MTITVDLALKRDAFHLDAAFTAPPGLTVLFGRSGSGKSTVIACMAGLVRPDRGRIALDDQILLDTVRNIHVPTHRRRIGTVFQEARLIPHLSVRRNLAYGRWFARGLRDAAGLEPGAVIDLLGIGHLLDRQVVGLSGGESQRVAIGRALLSRPRLLLMDEPLAALDAERKAEILPLIERLRDIAGLPIVYVSHAVSEVARLANTIVVLEGGRIAAAGPAEAILRRGDLGAFHAAQAGALLDMVVEADVPNAGLTRLSGRAGRLLVPRLSQAVGTTVRIHVPARDVLLSLDDPRGLSARNRLCGHVSALHDQAEGAVLVEVDCSGAVLSARLTRASVQDLSLAPGTPVFAIIKSVAFDPHGVGAIEI
ncbi:molybdenum ABC transporter ATP-binding protein [Methylobacterium sp. Leaf113]|uniref:molybdenum ABC transporter ATP-binding protein n=1 Tax=Methylobacterium sp. Leaf113 TaxID=1736259 RepID=UPI0006FCC911|nr:molybdenum ABC transporter ATP-binding protein [Methylobacterium sp. Leaf113]KQP94792.1 molybdenum ABC transporter ATP-binding protein [Methylobacterium sp. Leaf113]